MQTQKQNTDKSFNLKTQNEKPACMNCFC